MAPSQVRYWELQPEVAFLEGCQEQTLCQAPQCFQRKQVRCVEQGRVGDLFQ